MNNRMRAPSECASLHSFWPPMLQEDEAQNEWDAVGHAGRNDPYYQDGYHVPEFYGVVEGIME